MNGGLFVTMIEAVKFPCALTNTYEGDTDMVVSVAPAVGIVVIDEEIINAMIIDTKKGEELLVRNFVAP